MFCAEDEWHEQTDIETMSNGGPGDVEPDVETHVETDEVEKELETKGDGQTQRLSKTLQNINKGEDGCIVISDRSGVELYQTRKKSA